MRRTGQTGRVFVHWRWVAEPDNGVIPPRIFSSEGNHLEGYARREYLYGVENPWVCWERSALAAHRQRGEG